MEKTPINKQFSIQDIITNHLPALDMKQIQGHETDPYTWIFWLSGPIPVHPLQGATWCLCLAPYPFIFQESCITSLVICRTMVVYFQGVIHNQSTYREKRNLLSSHDWVDSWNAQLEVAKQTPPSGQVSKWKRVARELAQPDAHTWADCIF